MDTLVNLLEQAEAQRNAALAAFNQARARRDGARDQARDLTQYRDDYQQRWNQQFQRGAALSIVQCYRQFADRLELALAQQGHACTVTEQALARANDNLAAHELRVASVRKLIARRQSELRQLGERREQRDNDEWAQRLARNARGMSADVHP